MSRFDRDGDSSVGSTRPRARDEVIAKKRAKLALLDRIEEPRESVDADNVSAVRLLAEVDLAISEHRPEN